VTPRTSRLEKAIEGGGEGSWSVRNLGKGLVILIGLFVAFAILGPKGGTPSSPSGTNVPIGAGAPSTSAAATSNVPATPAPTASPVVLRGSGQTATDPFKLPGPISVAAFTHTGRRNFIVEAFHGSDNDLLVNTIGAYTGQRPMTGTEEFRLNIEADGAWTVTITAILCCATSGDYAGRGDSVSNQFNPRGTGAWQFSNTGSRNFIVQLHCRGGDDLVQNRIGPFEGSAILVFPQGPCYWEVESNGDWSLKPR
jgi:hypothetical protein